MRTNVINHNACWHLCQYKETCVNFLLLTMKSRYLSHISFKTDKTQKAHTIIRFPDHEQWLMIYDLCKMNYFTDWHDKSLWTHWGRVTHICVGNLTIIGPDNDLSPGRRQAIKKIRTNAGILLIEPFRTNFSEITIEIHTFSLKEMHLIMSSGKWRPFCLGLSVKSSGLIRKHIWNSTSTEILRQHAKHWLPNWELDFWWFMLGSKVIDMLCFLQSI